MISGDNLQTAIEVAKRAGILTEGEEKTDKSVMEGSEFREYVGGYRVTKDKDGNEKYSIVNQ
jgi:magnesium-transporting ATPase (P-type)